MSLSLSKRVPNLIRINGAEEEELYPGAEVEVILYHLGLSY